MRKLLVIMNFFCAFQSNAQSFFFKLQIDGLEEKLEANTEVQIKKGEKIFIREDSDNGEDYFLQIKDGEKVKFKSSNEPTEIVIKDVDFAVKPTILDKDEAPLFTFIFKDGSQPVQQDPQDPTQNDASNNFPTETAQDIFDANFTIDAKPYGLVVKSGETKFVGEKYVHIFLDQYGSLLNSTIPQGVSEKQYVVHILYVAPEKNREIFYSVRENKSSFNPALRFDNSDFRKLVEKSTVAISSGNKVQTKFRWYQQEILLSTSTTDIELELYLIIVSKSNYYTFEKKSLGKYTIKVTPTNHGTFDVGLIYSKLENPKFDLVTSPTNSNQQLVKKIESGKRGIVTAMATFYTSPILLIERYLMGKQVPDYKLSGRNILDDHAWYERIYPTVGVGFTDKTFENLFYGLNWEFARGGSFFWGWHLGKVDYLNIKNDFIFEETPITEADYNLRKNRKWQTSTAIGLKLDVKIILGLFGQNNNTQQ